MEYKIMIVDDEFMVREGLKALIGRLDRWVLAGEATNGEKAIEAFKRHQPDLVLSDIRMPEMDGLTLLERIREVQPDALVIFLTGYPDFEYAQKALRYGAFDYLLKPMRAQHIAEVIRKAEKKIDQIRLAQRQRQQFAQVVGDYEKWISERIARELIYGGDAERFDGSRLPFFKDCAQVSVVSLIAEPAGADDPATGAEAAGQALARGLGSPFILLKDGRHEWVMLVGWKPQEIPAGPARKLQDALTGLLERAAGPVWKAGIGCPVPVRQAGLSYDQSKFAVYLASPEKRVVCYQDISGTDPALLLVPIEQEFALIKSVRKGDPEEALAIFQELKKLYGRMALGELAKHALQLHVHLQNSLAALDEGGEGWALPESAPASRAEILRTLEKGIVHCADRVRAHRNRQVNHVIQRVIGIVHQKYYTDLKLGDLALKMGVNPSYLSTLFKQETGVPFSEYLSRYRIERSMTLLKNPELKIYEVAQEVGYADGRHYSQIFRRTVGMTPLEYRNRIGVPADPEL